MKTDRLKAWVVECDCCGGMLKAEESIVGVRNPIHYYRVFENEADALREAKEMGLKTVKQVLILCTHTQKDTFPTVS